ncbi:MAG: hypothetical protein DMF89_18170 [Acidobacteria bacterium]|nr:MAG: hypothetical protein DMF89_18170 [Acidobacteriota bacterium]
MPRGDYGRDGASVPDPDRDAIYAPAVDSAIKSMGLRVLKTPVRMPQANASDERLIGTTMRRECLDLLIPLHERHRTDILREWVQSGASASEPGPRDSRAVTDTDPGRSPPAIAFPRAVM